MRSAAFLALGLALTVTACNPGGPAGTDASTNPDGAVTADVVADSEAGGPLPSGDASPADASDAAPDAASPDVVGVDGATRNAALIGDWSTTRMGAMGINVTVTLHLGADGAMTFTVTGSGSCMGNLSYTGATWSATDTMLSKMGDFSCSGPGLTCTVMGVSTTSTCANFTMMPFSSCGAVPYTVSPDGRTLTITGCNGSAPTALTRM